MSPTPDKDDRKFNPTPAGQLGTNQDCSNSNREENVRLSSTDAVFPS